MKQILGWSLIAMAFIILVGNPYLPSSDAEAVFTCVFSIVCIFGGIYLIVKK